MMFSYHLPPLSPHFLVNGATSLPIAHTKSPEIIFVHLLTVYIPKCACFPEKHLINEWKKVNPQDKLQKKILRLVPKVAQRDFINIFILIPEWFK